MSPERRPRKAARIEGQVDLRFTLNGREERGVARNLSEIGLFVEASVAPPVGTQLTFLLTLGKDSKLEISGKVASNQSGKGGFGVSLETPPLNYLRFVSRLRGS